MKRMFFTLFVLLISLSVRALDLEKEVERQIGRGKKEVVCDKDNAFTVMAKLKKRTVIKLKKGDYKFKPITADEIILEGAEPGVYLEHLVIYGKNCVLKNLTVYDLEVKQGITVTDCWLGGFSTRRFWDQPKVFSKPATKAVYLFYNSYISNLAVYLDKWNKEGWMHMLHSESEIFIKNCIIYNSRWPDSKTNRTQFLHLPNDKLTLTVENSVIYSKDSFLGGVVGLKKRFNKYKITLKNNVIDCKNFAWIGDSKKGLQEYSSINEFSKYCRIIDIGNKIEKIGFHQAKFYNLKVHYQNESSMGYQKGIGPDLSKLPALPSTKTAKTPSPEKAETKQDTKEKKKKRKWVPKPPEDL
jgi:hypothetical protein